MIHDSSLLYFSGMKHDILKDEKLGKIVAFLSSGTKDLLTLQVQMAKAAGPVETGENRLISGNF